MEPYISQYGLTESPFPERPLDPLSMPGDDQTLVRSVDGFSVLVPVDAGMRQAVTDKKPLFFLVTGRNGSGRSSVANYILARYCACRGIAANKLLVPNRTPDSRDPFDVYQNWFTYLANLIDKESLSIPEQLKRDLDTYPSEVPTNLMVSKFQGLARRIGDALAVAGAGFACCLENVPTDTMLTSAFKIFEDAQIICVFTALDYQSVRNDVIKPIVDKYKDKPCHVIELGALEEADVKLLFKERWRHVSPADQHPFPFDENGIEEAFHGRRRTVGRALFMMDQLLAAKAAVSRSVPPWPAGKSLAFSTNELCDLVRTLDRRYRYDDD